jgi:hypothetical protein
MADLYTIWANKEGDISDLDWVNGMKSFFDHLISEGKMQSYRITRCKMGFRSIADMPEWMILMEFKDMGQMDSAFRRVAPLDWREISKSNTKASISLLAETYNTHCSVIGLISSDYSRSLKEIY